MLSSKLATLETEMASMRGYTFGYDSCKFVGLTGGVHSPHSGMFEIGEIKLFDSSGTWITVNSATSTNYHCTVGNPNCGSYDGGPHKAIDRITNNGYFGPSLNHDDPPTWAITLDFS